MCFGAQKYDDCVPHICDVFLCLGQVIFWYDGNEQLRNTSLPAVRPVGAVSPLSYIIFDLKKCVFY